MTLEFSQVAKSFETENGGALLTAVRYTGTDDQDSVRAFAESEKSLEVPIEHSNGFQNLGLVTTFPSAPVKLLRIVFRKQRVPIAVHVRGDVVRKENRQFWVGAMHFSPEELGDQRKLEVSQPLDAAAPTY